jgi:hypothetical protein
LSLEIRVGALDGCELNSQFLNFAPSYRGACGYIEIERGDHCQPDQGKQERANPLALNTPGSLFMSMDNLSSLHNDLYIWAIGRFVFL